MHIQTEKTDRETPPKPQVFPADGRRFFVRCATFRCLAYRDPTGAWRAVFGNEMLPEVLEVYQ